MNYLSILRKLPDFAGKTDLECELLLSRKKGVEKLTGLSSHQHRTRAMALLYPSRVQNAWRERLVKSYFLARQNRIKELMFLGASNSTKTSTLADLLLELWWECPEATSIYITSPYEDATETGLWARIVEQFQEAKDANPELPGKIKTSECKIVLSDHNPLSFIKVISIDQVGKLVGRKAKSFDFGMMFIAADELPEFRQNGSPLVRVMNNLISVPNMMLIGAGNFAQTTDALGVFAEPAFTVSDEGRKIDQIVGGYDGLRVSEHKEWISARNGLVVRFDGDDSPGVIDPEKFFFLPTVEYRDQLALSAGGKFSADFYRFWHSFPLVRSDEYTVTNITKVKQSGALDESYEWTGDPIVCGSHCDPGFGGDPAVLQPWRMGYVRTKDNSKIQVFEAWGAPITIPIDVSTSASTTPEEQIVKFHREYAERHDIPKENCSFDGSMRSGIVQEYGKGWSNEVSAIDSGGPATNRPMSVLKELVKDGKQREAAIWKDKVSSFITELWMAAASLIISGQIRGLQPAQESTVKQLCSRKWKWSGKKKQLETKKEYKADNSGKSPNEADALVGGIEIARRRGLMLHGVSAKDGGSMAKILALINSRKNNTITINGVELAIGGAPNPKLRSGTLRASHSNHTHNYGRLRRKVL